MAFQKPKPITKASPVGSRVKPARAVLPPVGGAPRSPSLPVFHARTLVLFLLMEHTCFSFFPSVLRCVCVCVDKKRVGFCVNFHHWYCAVEELVSFNCFRSTLSFFYFYFFQFLFFFKKIMLGAGALGRPRGMVWGGRREEGSGWGTHVYLWRMHFDIWQN